MILAGARVAQGPDETAQLDVEILGSKIVALRRPGRRRNGEIDLQGFLVLPGLINAHDHLEFNLFPRLGNGPYPNAGAWARDIYRPAQSPVKEHLRVSRTVRLVWGGLKNLLSGVTTVCQHNLYARVFARPFPVRVMKRYGWAHSLEFNQDLVARFHRTPLDWPFIVHLGEATDEDGRKEIFRLDQMGALDGRTVLVHAVGLGVRGWRLVKKKGASVIWCPSSNLFTLGRTLAPEALPKGIRLALGTDSALTGEGDLLDELRLAHRISGVSQSDLYRMVTEGAAGVLRLEKGAGTLSVRGTADLVVIRDRGQNPAASLFDPAIQGPEMVIIGGKIKLVSGSLKDRLPVSLHSRLSWLTVEGRGSVLVNARIPMLYERATRRLGPELCLAGKRVLP